MEKIEFNTLADLKVLHHALYSFKYGTSDEYKKLEIIGSPIFKDIFNKIRKAYIETAGFYVPIQIRQDANTIEYIEDNEKEYKIMLEYLDAFRPMVSDWEKDGWQGLSSEKKAFFIENLASPFSIRIETLKSLAD